jgi:hypothetical protein
MKQYQVYVFPYQDNHFFYFDHADDALLFVAQYKKDYPNGKGNLMDTKTQHFIEEWGY